MKTDEGGKNTIERRRDLETSTRGQNLSTLVLQARLPVALVHLVENPHIPARSSWNA